MSKLETVKVGSMVWVSFLAAVLLLPGWMANSVAREDPGTEVDLDALMREMIQKSKKPDKPDEWISLKWVPEEYWQASFAQDATITSAESEQFLKPLRPYIIIAIVDVKISPSGEVTYRSEADIRGALQLKDSQGTYYRPLSQDEIDADAKESLSEMKPFFGGQIGLMGQNTHFFAFPAKNRKGQKIADAKKQGAFSVKLGEKEFRWRLPLGTLLPPKICPKCKEEGSGAWNFCPWCGTKLRNKQKSLIRQSMLRQYKKKQ